MKSDEAQVREFLREKGNRLHHREGQELEFKEQFNFAGLAEYLRDFAAFANNRGGYLVYGVTDSPRRASGLSDSAFEMFDNIDPEKISGYILDIFSCDIAWRHNVIEITGKKYGYFHVNECITKPVIAKKNEGRDQEIRAGDIYYRYGGRTQRIQSAELESIINSRINCINQSWIGLMGQIGRIGPQNAAILDTDAGIIEKSPNQVLVVDAELASKLTFIKEGSFSEKDGSTTLKLIGDVVPVDRLEVIKMEKEHLIRSYPLSAIELASEVKKHLPPIKQNEVWGVIKENQMKDNLSYSAYNFRSKKHEDKYRNTGYLPNGTPSIYNNNALDFIVKVLSTIITE